MMNMNLDIIILNLFIMIADKKFLEAIKTVDSSKKSLYIIDEVHNFIRNVYSNISSNKGKRAQTIYDYIIQDKSENPDTRTILLSATPAINNPYEIGLLFNLLRPGIFPRSENEFNHLFISDGSYRTMNSDNKNMFQRRIMGLVTYYVGARPDFFASKTINYIDVEMSDYHKEVYKHYEEIEEKIAMRSRLRGGKSQTYKSYTRQASNFVFPYISQRINGEERPRPNKFRVSEREAMKVVEGQESKDLDGFKSSKGSDQLLNVSKYIESLNTYVTSFDNHLASIVNTDKEKGHTIIKDIELYLEKYRNNFNKFHKEVNKKSGLYDELYKCSGKMLNIIFNILSSKGPVTVYSNYVLMEGLEIFKIYLKYFGFYNYMKSKKLLAGKVGYVEFHGGIKDISERYDAMEVFNKSVNKYGDYLKIMLISPAGTEGLNLKNVRQVHIMEPYWNEVRITQMIGRAVRLCSHKDLSISERHVEVYRYKSVRTGGKWTTDQYIEDLARSKDNLIQSFLDPIKEVAVDCRLNENENKVVESYKCFQFEESSLFDKYIGPAYRDDIYDDMKIDNGSNSNKAITLKIKVMKISAVKQLTEGDDETEPTFSESEDYWFYPKSGVVYDFNLKYPIGKVAMEEDGSPIKLDKDTYIIDREIPIPKIDF